MKTTLIFAAAIFVSPVASSLLAQSIDVRVEITNNAPTGGIAITPPWVGFHAGTFDSYNGGLASQPGLESIAEDGATALLSTQFLDFDTTNGGYTYVGPGPSNALVRTGDLRDRYRVDGTLVDDDGTPPLLPGDSISQDFTIRIDGSNRFFSYASMVLPSNDFYIANGNPAAHDLANFYDGEGSISFNIGLPGTINDAGTEATDYRTSAANGLFGLAGGQGGPDTPSGSLGLANMNVSGDPFAGFGVDTPDTFNFNDAGLYPNGIATVRLTVVPEPSTSLLGLFAMVGALIARRRRR